MPTPSLPRPRTVSAARRTAASVAANPPVDRATRASRSTTPPVPATSPTRRSPPCIRRRSAGSRSPGRMPRISSAAGTSATRASCVARPACVRSASPARAPIRTTTAAAGAGRSTFRASRRRSTRATSSRAATAAATARPPRPNSVPRRRLPESGLEPAQLDPVPGVLEIDRVEPLGRALVERAEHGSQRRLVVDDVGERLLGVAGIDLPVLAAIEGPAAALLVGHLHAQVEGRRGLARALPGLDLDLAAGLILRKEQVELAAAELPAKHVDHVPPLRRATDRAELALRVIEQDEVGDHVAIVAGRVIDPQPVDGVLGGLGLVGQQRAAELPDPEGAGADQRQ